MERILIVEDFKEARTAMVDILMDDYEVSEAASVEEAFQAAQAAPFELLLSDIRLEGPEDGIAGLGRIRPLQPEIRAILITGFADEEAPGRAIGLGVDDYLYKPFNRITLLRSVQNVMNSEGELSRYEGWLARAWPGRGPLPANLDALRRRAFSAFYVGVRSRKLGPSAALGAYERLELLERRRLEPTLDLDELARGYEYVATHVGDPTGSLTLQLERRLNTVEPEVFGRFAKRLDEGTLTQAMVLVAPAVRTGDVATLGPELAQVRATLWG